MSYLKKYQQKSGIVTQQEITLKDQWLKTLVSQTKAKTSKSHRLDGWLGTKIPFTFLFNGRPADEILPTWTFTVERLSKTEDCERLRLIWTDPDTGLRVICHLKHFLHYPAVDWLLSFENTGAQDTPIIEDVRVLRLSLTHSQKNQGYTVHGCKGGRTRSDDFVPFVWSSDPGRDSESFVLGDDFSSNNHLPFWNIETPEDRGLMVGVGWTGVWRANLEFNQNKLAITAGMPKTHFLLHPGEKARSPRIMLLFWQGQSLHGHNMLRRLLYRHYLRAPVGPKHKPLVTVNTCFTHHGKGSFLQQATEETLTPLIKPVIELGVEALVIDAAWYRCTTWRDIYRSQAYEMSRKQYPNGFRFISEPLRRAGIFFGLWFAPEGKALGAFVDEAHRAKLLDYIATYVHEEYMTMYRQDGFLSKFDFVRYPDEPNRVGMNEIRHFEGLYQLWDQIIARYPDMLMEGCSGGGRRVDLETIQRFSWFQKSDRWFDSESDQRGLYGINMFLPGGYVNIPTEGVDNYRVWSSFAGQLCLGWHPIDDDFDMEKAKKQVALYKKIRHLLSGDFYALTECAVEEPWIGYQFHRTDLHEGLVLLFRRNTPYSSIDIKLNGLEPSSYYRLHFHGRGRQKSYTGRELARDLAVSIDKNPGAELIRYRKQ